MRVGLCSIYHFSSYPGGNERYTHELALALIRLGHQVCYITGAADVPPQPYPVINLPLYYLRGQSLPSISWIFPNLPKLDILHTSGTGIPMHLAVKTSGIPGVHTFQAQTYPENMISLLGSRMEQYLIFHCYRQVIATTPYYRSRLLKQQPQAAVTFIPLFLPQTYHRYIQVKRQPHLLLFVGTLDRHHYYKGLDVLLLALSKLPSKFQLIVAGGGERQAYFQSLSAQFKLGSRVKFLGNADDHTLIKLYRRCAFLIQPSTSDAEGFGLSLLEAMSQKLPVIITSAIASSSWLKSEQAVLIVPPHDPDALTQIILKSGHQPNQTLIQSAYRFALKLSSLSVAKQTVNLYQGLLT